MLSSVFNSDEDLNTLFNRFSKKLKGCVAKNFKKVRITDKRITEEENMHTELTKLKEGNDDESKKKMEQLVEALAALSSIKIS